MKNVILIKSIKDLAAKKAEAFCDKSKPYYQTFVQGMEKKIVDDLVEKAIEEENTRMVETVLRSIFKAEDASPIPVPFEINGEVYTQIKKDRYSFEVTSDGENWRYLTDENEIRLYVALETAGCLDSIE